MESLSKDQVQKMRSMFDMIDQDGDGIICSEDLQAVFKSVGLSDQAKDKELHKKMLEENSDELNFAHFVKIITSRQSRFSSAENLHESFQRFEHGNDKGLKKSELDVDSLTLQKNLEELAGDVIDKSQIKTAMSNYEKKDNLTGNQVFMATRFINSVEI